MKPCVLKSLFLSLITSLLSASEPHFPWVVYYGASEPSSAFEAYNPIVFESDAHPDLSPLLAKKKEILGYVNLGEVDDARSWFEEIKKLGIIIRENPNWKGSWLVDVRSLEWQKFLIEKIIPDIFAQGFNGLFFDQLDVAIALETEDPLKYHGMARAVADLIITIHKEFPKSRIMVNRGYEVLDDIGNVIDYLLAESLYTDYDFTKKTYVVRTSDDYSWQMNHINRGRKKFPSLVVFSLDYWDPSDTEMVREIYALERKACLRPYVTVLSLTTLTPEP